MVRQHERPHGDDLLVAVDVLAVLELQTHPRQGIVTVEDGGNDVVGRAGSRRAIAPGDKRLFALVEVPASLARPDGPFPLRAVAAEYAEVLPEGDRDAVS